MWGAPNVSGRLDIDPRCICKLGDISEMSPGFHHRLTLRMMWTHGEHHILKNPHPCVSSTKTATTWPRLIENKTQYSSQFQYVISCQQSWPLAKTMTYHSWHTLWSEDCYTIPFVHKRGQLHSPKLAKFQPGRIMTPQRAFGFIKCKLCETRAID